jgi:predicted SpoU family rRNA methylase
MKAVEDKQSDAVPSNDDDERLKERVQNVFEALQNPVRSSQLSSQTSNLDDAKLQELRGETEGVDAVMIVVDGDKVGAQIWEVANWIK